ncbi:hypothetical protein ACTFIV_003696 [Dictyostelium citrinum]
MDEYTKDFPWMYIVICLTTIISVTIFYILVSFFIKRYRNKKNEELGHALLTKIVYTPHVYTPHYNSQPICNSSGHYSIINQPIQQPQQTQQPQIYYSNMIV